MDAGREAILRRVGEGMGFMVRKSSCGGPSGDCKQAVWVMTRVQVWISQPYGTEIGFGPGLSTKVVTDSYGSGEELLLHGMGTREVCRT